MAWTCIITSVGDVTVGMGISSENLNTSLVPKLSMHQADMQPWSLEGDVQTCLLGRTLQPALASALPEPAAALARDTHSSLLVVMTRTEPVSAREGRPTTSHLARNRMLRKRARG